MFKKTGEIIRDVMGVYERVEPVPCRFIYRDARYSKIIGQMVNIISVGKRDQVVLDIGGDKSGWADENFGPNYYLYALNNGNWFELMEEENV